MAKPEFAALLAPGSRVDIGSAPYAGPFLRSQVRHLKPGVRYGSRRLSTAEQCYSDLLEAQGASCVDGCSIFVT